VTRRNILYPSVSDEQWCDWRWQLRNRLTSLEGLEQVVQLTAEERAAWEPASQRFRMAITPYYAQLMDATDPDCPIRRQAIPTLAELEVHPGEMRDPLDEEGHLIAPALTHRYPDRALLYTTHNCAMYCRFCTRKRKVSDPTSATSHTDIEKALETIRQTPAIQDVIISGGDALSLSTERLGGILRTLNDIPHVTVARIGTRNLVTLPQRVDPELCAMLRAMQTRNLAVYLMTHFNHVRECTEDAWNACDAIADTGTPIQNQMVLLRSVNDSTQAVIALNRQLLRMRVKPYYILQADLAEGIGHFRTPLETGLSIMEGLRGHVSGLAVPQFVVDLPGGAGKVPLVPEYRQKTEGDGTLFRNYQGRSVMYPGCFEAGA
jgi:lysine 2,3-aminomutase